MKPLQDGKEPSDLTIMKSGVYNLGFLGLRNDAQAGELLDWWSDRCYCQCRIDIAGNMFTDQRWMDLAPCFVDETVILRHAGYNVAYWNLAHWVVRRLRNNTWTVNKGPLRFFHFSGIKPDDPRQFSKHQNRYSVSDLGTVAELCEAYRGQVLANGWNTTSKVAYGFGYFRDGRVINDHMRRWLLRAIDEARLDRNSDLNVSPDYFDQLDEAAPGRCITRFMYQFWLDRPDLQAAFNLGRSDGPEAYSDWFVGGEAEKQGVDRPSVAAAERLRKAPPAAMSVAELPGPSATPWVRLATQVFDRDSARALAFLDGDEHVSFDGHDWMLPRQAALLWERRPDLQRVFDVTKLSGFMDYLSWVVTSGAAERSIDASRFSAAFTNRLRRLSSISDYYRDVPITEGMIVSRGADIARAGSPGWTQFPVERVGRLAHAFWFAFFAPEHFGWPPELASLVITWFHEKTPISVDGYHLTRATMYIWEVRPDVQRVYPLADQRSRRDFLNWLISEGAAELSVRLESLDPGLPAFLEGRSPRYPGISQFVELAYERRVDLRKAYDITQPSGCAELMAWAAQYLQDESKDPPLRQSESSGRDPKKVSKPRRLKVQVALTGNWASPTGRGEDIRGTAAALLAVGFKKFAIVDFDKRRFLASDGSALTDVTGIDCEVNVVHLNADTAVDDALRLNKMNVHATRTVGYWAWELEFLPPYWRHAYSFFDEIWASTKFALAAFRKDRARPVKLVPMLVLPGHEGGIRTSRTRFDLPKEAAVFLFMFDFKSYISRKNPAAVIAAFRTAFPRGSEKAYLLLKTCNGESAAADLRALRAAAGGDPRIEIRDSILPRTTVTDLIKCADAFVSLHRSEGFGRGPAEAMALGIPVIVTDYSGTRDFASQRCALIVPYTLVKVAKGSYPGACGQRWADPKIAVAAQRMKWVVRNRRKAKALGQRGKETILRIYEPKKVGQQIIRALQIAKSARDAAATGHLHGEVAASTS